MIDFAELSKVKQRNCPPCARTLCCGAESSMVGGREDRGGGLRATRRRSPRGLLESAQENAV